MNAVPGLYHCTTKDFYFLETKNVFKKDSLGAQRNHFA